MRKELVLGLVLATLPFATFGAATGEAPPTRRAAPSEPLAGDFTSLVEPAPMHGPVCILGHQPVICPFQCDDGADNDGDGLVDQDDPDCTSGTDDKEAPDQCFWSQKIVHAAIETVGSNGGTKVSTETTFLYGCPGGPVITSDAGSYCTWGNGWNNNACFWSAFTATEREVSAEFSCGSPSCSGQPSPHYLRAKTILVDNAGNALCGFDATPGTNTAWHCEWH